MIFSQKTPRGFAGPPVWQLSVKGKAMASPTLLHFEPLLTKYGYLCKLVNFCHVTLVAMNTTMSVTCKCIHGLNIDALYNHGLQPQVCSYSTYKDMALSN